MELVGIGLNHKTAQVEVREKVSLTSSQKEKIYQKVKLSGNIKEGLVLNTCNRTELYLASTKVESAKEFGLKLLEIISDIKLDEIIDQIYIKHNIKAVDHLFRVVTGIDSQIVGEVQIMSQVKKAYEKAEELNVVDTYLHRLFNKALRVGKRARTETNISNKAASISSAAVDLAGNIFGSLAGETVLILGAGETSELTLKNLVDYGIKGVMVANRTYQNGQKLAEEYGGEVIRWERLNQWLKEVDIVIGSTGAPHYVLNKEDVKKAVKLKRGPMFLIDIAVPRDIDPEVEEIDGVHLYDIDDLETVVENNIEERKEEIQKVEFIIEEEVKKFKNWARTRRCVPLIKDMRKRAVKIKDKEVKRALNKLSDNNQEPEKILEELSHRLVNKLLHPPTVGVKEIAKSRNGKQKLDIIKEALYENF